MSAEGSAYGIAIRSSRSSERAEELEALSGEGFRTVRACFTLLVNAESTAGWFAVRCLFRKGWPPPTDDFFGGHRYEERITLRQASSADEAIAKAEAEALDYAAVIEEAPSEYLGLAQSYALADTPDQNGAEAFSLIRDSNLEPASDLVPSPG